MCHWFWHTGVIPDCRWHVWEITWRVGRQVLGLHRRRNSIHEGSRTVPQEAFPWISRQHSVCMHSCVAYLFSDFFLYFTVFFVYTFVEGTCCQGQCKYKEYSRCQCCKLPLCFQTKEFLGQMLSETSRPGYSVVQFLVKRSPCISVGQVYQNNSLNSETSGRLEMCVHTKIAHWTTI